MKKCRNCNKEKTLDCFYKHKQMRDGHLNKCIQCVKDRVSRHRKKNIDRIREYDRSRGNRQSKSYRLEYRVKFPNKCKAQTMVGNAIRDGKLFREPCEVCGETYKIHGHHDDYLKPLNVRWLCPAHHSQWHTEHGEAENAR